MIRIAIFFCALILVLQGPAFGQGFLDSVLGPGGLGLWGAGDPSQQFNTQQYYGSPQEAQQQMYPQGHPGQQPAAPQGYPQQGYGQASPQSYYPSQQGVYSDWQNYQNPPDSPAPTGPPPARYVAPPVQTAPAPQVQGPPMAPPQGAVGGAPLRPGQYSPGQPPVGDVEQLPSGAVRVTTTTPDGTTIQYYPPAGEPIQGQPGVRPQTRQPGPQGATKPRRIRAKEQGAAPAAPTTGSNAVAMPKPVEIPQGQDPRTGWGPAVNRMPGAGPSR